MQIDRGLQPEGRRRENHAGGQASPGRPQPARRGGPCSGTSIRRRRPASCSARRRTASGDAQAVFAKDVDPAKLIRPTGIDRLDLLPADASLRGLDRFLFGLGKKKRLLKLIEDVGRDYDRILLDAPPGLTETSEQVLRAADLIIVPVIPSPLSQRALDEVVAYLDRHAMRRGPILPVYNMVDRRRSLHRAALEANPDWPVIPMASAFEAISAPGGGVGRLPAASPAGAGPAGAVGRDRETLTATEAG